MNVATIVKPKRRLRIGADFGFVLGLALVIDSHKTVKYKDYTLHLVLPFVVLNIERRKYKLEK